MKEELEVEHQASLWSPLSSFVDVLGWNCEESAPLHELQNMTVSEQFTWLLYGGLVDNSIAPHSLLVPQRSASVLCHVQFPSRHRAHELMIQLARNLANSTPGGRAALANQCFGDRGDELRARLWQSDCGAKCARTLVARCWGSFYERIVMLLRKRSMLRLQMAAATAAHRQSELYKRVEVRVADTCAGRMASAPVYIESIVHKRVGCVKRYQFLDSGVHRQNPRTGQDSWCFNAKLFGCQRNFAVSWRGSEYVRRCRGEVELGISVHQRVCKSDVRNSEWCLAR